MEMLILARFVRFRELYTLIQRLTFGSYPEWAAEAFRRPLREFHTALDSV